MTVEELRDKIHARVPYMDIDVTLLIAAAHAVIREASVGVVKLSHNGVASDYDIIPKETP